MLRAPFKESLVPHWLSLCTLALVVWADNLSEVLAVGEVKGDVVGIKSLLEVFEFPFKDVQHHSEVTGNGD